MEPGSASSFESRSVPMRENPYAQSHARLDLRDEVRVLADKAQEEARNAARAARQWSAVHLALGFPTAVLAAVAGATGLASTTGRIPAAILALVAASLSAGATFLKSDSRAAEAQRRAGALSILSTDARLVSAFEGNRARSAEIRNQLSLPVGRYDAILANDYDQARRLRDEGVGRPVNPGDYPYATPG
jgi:hypothetical protein